MESQTIDRKDPLKAYSFAMAAAVIFSFANFSMSWLSDLQEKAIYPQWFASFLILGLYHAYTYFTREDKQTPFMSKQNSAYFSKVSVVVPEPGTAIPDIETNKSGTLHQSEIQSD